MRGQFRFDSCSPQLAAPAYATELARLLRKAEPRELEVHGGRVFVRGGFFRFVSRWNLLGCVTSATIQATPSEPEVICRSEIRLTGLVALWSWATLSGV